MTVYVIRIRTSINSGRQYVNWVLYMWNIGWSVNTLDIKVLFALLLLKKMNMRWILKDGHFCLVRKVIRSFTALLYMCFLNILWNVLFWSLFLIFVLNDLCSYVVSNLKVSHLTEITSDLSRKLFQTCFHEEFWNIFRQRYECANEKAHVVSLRKCL